MIDGVTDAALASEAEQPLAQLATIGAVYEDGVTLIFDGQETATEKHYKCNTSVSFAAGDRVKVASISGSYVVEYVVGAPKSGGGSGGTVSELVNGNFRISLDVSGNLIPTGAVKLGTSTKKFDALYAGAMNSPGSSYLGFYDKTYNLQSLSIYKTINSTNQIAALQAVMDRLVELGIFK